MSSRSLGKDSLLGAHLRHYQLLEKIGAGGMGEVYRATDQHLGRDVAIKVLPPGTLAHESARKNFRKEALTLSKLNHPNVATIHDFDTQHGIDFLVMEYIPGITLSARVAKGPLPEKEILSLGVQLAEGLSAAHEHGVIHRDLKPGNLRLSNQQQLKILDFGLAKLPLALTTIASTQSFSEEHEIAGTLPYMAPEQLRAEQIDARTDVHAAGAVLYEMATGKSPFSEIERSQLIGAILHKTPLRPGMLNHNLSPELERIIKKCLEKEPENRYQSAKELAVDLRGLARERDSAPLLLDSSRSRLRSVNRHQAKFAIGAAIALVGLVLAAALWLTPTKGVRSNVSPSIAVLPFIDLSPEKDEEYFSDGLAEELLNNLVRLQALHVAARTSSFQFKGKSEDVREIGKKLNVDTILEGSVRKQGRRVRVSAQLIKVSDGYHLWSDSYDRDVTDIFAVQEDIAQSVARSLKLTLLGTTIPAPRPTTVEAYNAYLQGRYSHARPTKENLEKAIAYYQKAVTLDASYAPAWAALSRAHSIQAAAYGPLQEEISKARDAANRALVLDPGLAEAHAAIGEIKLDYDWDWAGADAAYQRALALERGNAEIVERAASLAATLNRFDDALFLSHRAVELDPLLPSAHYILGFNSWWGGRLDEADTAARKGLELDPEFPWLHMLLSRIYLARSNAQEALSEAEREGAPVFHYQQLALAYFALGRKSESDRALKELLSKYKATGAFQIAEVYAGRGDVDAAFTWLERAYSQRDGGLTFVKGDPLLASLENDRRYGAFLKKMGLPR
jgi:eukaryotic-like serine/threonine-protein kinase